MSHQSALVFLKNIGKKMRLPITVLTPAQNDTPSLDLGLRDFLSQQEQYDRLFRDRLLQTEPNTVYRLTDEFACSYLYLLLPDMPRFTVLLAGPYLTASITQEEILSQAERFGAPLWVQKKLAAYYLNLPVIPDPSTLVQLFAALGETLWGGPDSFRFQDLTLDSEHHDFSNLSIPEENDPQQLLLDMQILQKRYDVENELMHIISRGQIHRAERFSSSFDPAALQSRVADSLRNMKNYCIIGNTLMRKAAEQGGVHPVFLDRISSGFAVRIENITVPSAMRDLFGDMIRSYCRLVRKHTAQHYSPLVEKAVLCIEADLSRDLSLHTVAATLNASAGYLSSLFRKETGLTLTEYVTRRRMEYAASLLVSTRLQIQSIAQNCGYVDVQYFSRVFRKIHGQSPLEYRKHRQEDI